MNIHRYFSLNKCHEYNMLFYEYNKNFFFLYILEREQHSMDTAITKIDSVH